MSKISKAIRQARLGVSEEPEKQDSPAAQAVRLAAYGAASGRLREREEQEAQAAQSLRLAAYGLATGRNPTGAPLSVRETAKGYASWYDRLGNVARDAEAAQGRGWQAPEDYASTWGGVKQSADELAGEAGKYKTWLAGKAGSEDMSPEDLYNAITGIESGQKWLGNLGQNIDRQGQYYGQFGSAEEMADWQYKHSPEYLSRPTYQRLYSDWQAALAEAEKSGGANPEADRREREARAAVEEWNRRAEEAKTGQYRSPEEEREDRARSPLMEPLDYLGDVAANAYQNFNPLSGIAGAMEIAGDALNGLLGIEKDPNYVSFNDAVRMTAAEQVPLSRNPEEWGDLGKAIINTAGAASNMAAQYAFWNMPFSAANAMGAQSALAPYAGYAPEMGLGGSAASNMASRLISTGAKIGMDVLRSPGNFGVSLGSGTSSYAEARDSGANFSQALTNGMAKGLAEYFSNKLFSGTPFENASGEKGYVTKLTEYVAEKLGKEQRLIDFNKSTGGKLFNWLFDKAGEGLEEVVTGIADPWIDKITYDWNTDIATADELVEEFAGGLLLSLMLAPLDRFGNIRERDYNRRTGRVYKTGQTVTELEVDGGTVTVPPVDEATAGLIESGLESPEGTESRELAETLLEKAKAGKTISAEETGRLAQANDAAFGRDSAEEALREAMAQAEEERQTGGNTAGAETETPQQSGFTAAERRMYQDMTRTANREGPVVTDTDRAADRVAERIREAEGARESLDKAAEASDLGENGRAYLRSLYTGGETGSYFGGFMAYYNAGMANESADAVSTRRGETLTPEQRQAAWNAGRMDAVWSIRDNGKAVTAKEPGYVRDAMAKKANPTAKEERYLDVLGKATGTRIVFGELDGDTNAEYDAKTATITVNVKAKDPVIAAATHEIVHRVRDMDPQAYRALRDFVVQNLSDERLQMASALRSRVYETNDVGYYTEELVADAFGRMAQDQGILEDFVREHRTAGQRFLDAIRDVIDRIKRFLKTGGESRQLSEGQRAEFEELLDRLTLAQATLEEALGERTADNAETDRIVLKDGVAMPADMAAKVNGDVKPADYMDDDYVRESVHSEPGWEKNYRAMGGEERVARALRQFTEDMIGNDVIYNYVPHGVVKYDAHGPLRKNIEYIITFDMDASCPRTFQFLNYRNRLMRMAGRPLTFNESIQLMELMRAYGQQVPCTYCYVENKRILMASSYLNWFDFHNAVLSADTDEEARKQMYSYNAKNGTLSDAAEKVFAEWRGGDRSYRPGAAEVWTAVQTAKNSVFNWLDNGSFAKTGRKSLVDSVCRHFGVKDKLARNQIGDFVDEWIYDRDMKREHDYAIQNNEDVSEVDQRALAMHRTAMSYAKSASSARTVDNYAPYTDQFKNITAAQREKINAQGGVRKHSSNDFRIDYVQDYFLFFADLALNKMFGHTYTKNGDYVRIFGRTGDRINISVAFDEVDGKVIENKLEGMLWKEAQQLRKDYYENVGVMAMVTSDAQLSYALNADWVDMIIPFHQSGLKKEVWYNLKMWSDYTSKQNEKWYTSADMKRLLGEKGIDVPKNASAEEVKALFDEHIPTKKIVNENGDVLKPHFLPGEFTVNGQTVPGHHNDKETYLRLCREYGVKPRFDGVMVDDGHGNQINVVDHPNYMKLVKETARTETEQKPIQFNLDEVDPALGMSPMDYAMKRMQQEAENGGFGNLSDDPYHIVDEFRREYLGKDKPLPAGLDTEGKPLAGNLEEMLTERAQKFREQLLEMQAEDAERQAKILQQSFKATKDLSVRQSRVVSDEDYMAAVERGDMETAQRMVDEAARAAGYTRRAFHQTGAKNITVFDLSIGTNGGTDSETPYGVFTKRTNADIGLGDVQMSLYVRPGKTLRFKNREELHRYFGGEYKAILDEIDAINNRYDKLYDAAEDEAADLQDKWLDAHPEIDTMSMPVEEFLKGDFYTGKEVRAAMDKADSIMRRWTESVNNLSIKAKEVLTEMLKAEGYDSVEILVDSGSSGRKTDTFISLDNRAVKSADPVTYDDEGNVIPLSERFNPNREDIRYSRSTRGAEVPLNENVPVADRGSSDSQQVEELRRTADALTRENERLRKRVDYWRGQTKQTRGLHLRLGDLNRLTGQLVKDYAAVLDENEGAELREAVARLAKLMREDPKGLQYNEMLYHAEDVARTLVQNASELVNDDEYQDYKDFKKWLRGQKITISRQDAGFIPDFAAWKKAHSAIRVGYDNGGLPIDTAYSELAGQFPGFFPESITNPTDQLERIAEVLDSMGPVYDNPYSADMAAAVEYATFDVLERIMDEDTVRTTPPTAADRAKEKLDAQKERNKWDVAFARSEERVKGERALEKQADKYEQQLADMKNRYDWDVEFARSEERLRRQRQAERYEDRLARYRDTLKKVRERRDEELARVRRAHKMQQQRQSAAKLRARIERHAKDLYRELTRPTDKKHIPEALRSSVAKVLQAINLESGKEYAFIGGDYKLVQRGTELGAEPTKKTQLFAAMKEQLAKAENSGEATLDPNLLGFDGETGLLDEVIAMGEKPLADMSRDELQKVWDVLKQVEKAVKDWNKAFAAGRYATISEIAGALWGENARKRDTLTLAGAAGRAQQLFNLDMLTPEAYFHRLGPTGDALFRALRQAQDNDTRLLDLAVQKAQEVIGDYDVRKAEQETVKVTLGGEEAEITRAQLMEIYVLLRREQALKHLEGGILPAATRKGVVQNKRAEPYRLNSIEELANACAKLTDEERRIAEALQRFVTVTAAEWGNAASMAVYGYRKFGGEEHYWPLHVNRQDVKSTIEGETGKSSVKNYGFSKPLTPNANNSVRIGSIFDTFAEHTAEMATYSTHLEIMEDLMRVLNYKQRNEEGLISWTTKGIMDRVFGNGGTSYLQTLLEQLSYGVKGETIGGDFMSATSGRYKGSAIGANLRVILQQPTAILRALDMIRPDYLAEGLGSWRRGWQRAQKYAPIAKWKSWGYFDVATGKSIKSLMFNSDSKLSKFNSALMAPAGLADAFAWGQLWSACEKELEAQIKKGSVPGVEPGTEAFYQRVAERFSEIVDRTQVVDGILQRSQIMRSPDRLVKMATSFMAEPTKQYNQFMSAVYDLRHSGGKKERRDAMKHLARTLLALLASFAANAAAQSLIDGLRDDDREKKYFERFLGAYPGNLLDNVNPLSFVPWARDVSSLIQGYSVDRMDMTTVSNIVNAVKGTTKALQGEGKKSVANALTTLAAEAARLFGLPVANIKRDVLAIVNTVATETDNFLMQYEIDKVLYPVAANTSRYAGILWQAYQKDSEQYPILYERMVADGADEKKLKDAMENRMKEAQGVEKVGELDQRYMNPEQQSRYDGLHKGMERSGLWRNASTEERERVEDKLYQLVAQTDTENSAGTKLQEKIDAAGKAGISEGEYMLYLLALSMADEPTDKGTYGTYTNDEQEAALDMLDGLSREDKSWLWMSTHDSDKNNPYK